MKVEFRESAASLDDAEVGLQGRYDRDQSGRNLDDNTAPERLQQRNIAAELQSIAQALLGVDEENSWASGVSSATHRVPSPHRNDLTADAAAPGSSAHRQIPVAMQSHAH